MSELMPWNSSYSVGDDSIDSEHKRIVNLINELYLILHTRGEGDRIKVREVLDQLVRYTVSHFQHEERLMLECGYPDLEAHKALHVRLKRRTAAMRTNIDLVTERDMLCYLKDWWRGHIVEQDQLYAPFLTVTAR
jgi:hemerythrin-like metal-binding protein